LLSAAANWHTSCDLQDKSFGRVLAQALRHVMGFGQTLFDNDEEVDVPTACLYQFACVDFVALLMSSVTVGLFSVKFLTPTVSLVVTRNLLALQRDGQMFLSFRIAHPQGHVVNGVDFTVSWMKPKETVEGETFMEHIPIELNFQGSGVLNACHTITHKIDESSPLFSYISDLREAPGYFCMHCLGQDTRLQAPAFASRVYPLWHTVVQHRWADTAMPGADGRWPSFDLGKIDEVVVVAAATC